MSDEDKTIQDIERETVERNLAILRKAEAERAAEANKRVQRTADGNVGNKITVGLKLTVIIDQPAGGDDTFELVSNDGKHKILDTNAAEDLVPGEKVLCFVGINPNKSYKLYHVPSKKQKRRVVFNINQQQTHVTWKPYSQMFAPGQKLHFSNYYLYYPFGENLIPYDKDLHIHYSQLNVVDP